MSAAFVQDLQGQLGAELGVLQKSAASAAALFGYNELFKNRDEPMSASLEDAAVLGASSAVSLTMTGPIAQLLAEFLPEGIVHFGDRLGMDLPENVLIGLVYSAASYFTMTSIHGDPSFTGFLKTWLLGFAASSAGESAVTYINH